MHDEALEQGRIHLDLLAALADHQGSTDPFSPWHDVGLHAQLAAARLHLIAHPAESPARGTHPEPPSTPGTDAAPNRLGQILLDYAESLLTSAATAARSSARSSEDHDNFLQARLEIARARTFLHDVDVDA